MNLDPETRTPLIIKNKYVSITFPLARISKRLNFSDLYQVEYDVILLLIQTCRNKLLWRKKIMINLKDITLETRTVTLSYPGMPNFKLELNYMSRATSKRVITSAKRDEWVNGTLIQVQDDDKFIEAFVDAAIKG